MIPTFLALLFLGQTVPTWQTFTCDGGGCTINVTNGMPTIDKLDESRWNYLNVLCMNGPRQSSEADPKAFREFFPVCEQFDYDNDWDLDLKDFWYLQKETRRP